MKPQPEIGDTQLSGEENKLAELERPKSIIETEDHRGYGDAIRLIQLKAEMEALEKTSCTTSNEPKTIVADENSYPNNAGRVFI
jgi:hypothetical protein